MTKTIILYAVAAIAVLALASVYPKLAMFFVGLLILGVLVEHGQEYAALILAPSSQGGKS